MSNEVNPYTAPAFIEASVDSNDSAIRKLRAPSLGLLILSGFTAVPGLLWLPMLVLSGILYVLGFRGMPTPSPLELAIGLPLIGSNWVILFGSWNMRQGTRYRLAYVSAVLSSIPILSAAGYLGIPFGIWALIVLHRRDVKEAFARNAEDRAQKISSHEPPVG